MTIAVMEVTDWLLKGDPAIRWQVMRDLTGASAEAVAAERARVESEGWGARLLDLRDPDGQWAGGACFPRYVAENWRAGIQPDFSHCQPWTSTLPALMLLRDFGLDPDCKAARETTALSRRTVAGSTTARRSSTARWSRASTVGRWRSCLLRRGRRRPRQGAAC